MDLTSPFSALTSHLLGRFVQKRAIMMEGEDFFVCPAPRVLRFGERQGSGGERGRGRRTDDRPPLIGRQIPREAFEGLGAVNDDTPLTGTREDREIRQMTRVARDACCSSDLQRQVSIDDRFGTPRARAEREGSTNAATCHDATISASSVLLMPGVQALPKDARQDGFNPVPAEALDRLSRDQADMAMCTDAEVECPLVGRWRQRTRTGAHDVRQWNEGPRAVWPPRVQ